VTLTKNPWWPPTVSAAALASAGLLAVGLGVAPGPALAAASRPASPPRYALAGSRPAWASPAADAGQVPAGTQVSARVYLAGRDPSALAAYARQVSEPGDAAYGHYLTPAQYRQRFGPTASQTAAVRQWLTGAGLHVASVTSHYVAFSGPESAVAAAFGTSLHSYRVSGTVRRAPQATVTVPAAVGPDVLTVSGLATGSVPMTPDLGAGSAGLTGTATSTATPPSPFNEGPCSRYWGQRPASGLPPAYGHRLDYALCGYVPAQFRAAYGVTGSGLSGQGVTIAITGAGASPTIVSDVDSYVRRHGGQRLRPGQLAEVLPADLAQSCGTSQAPYAEEHLDVEAAHGMAPDARIVYVAGDCSGTTASVLDPLSSIVDGHLADIVSDSWHLGLEAQMPPGLVPAMEQIFEQGAVEGIGFYFSSGDHGDWSQATPSHQPAVQYPGSDPWVTSVGGTSLATGPGGRYEWETGWGSDLTPLAADGTSWTGLPGTFAGGAGGGTSALFGQPFYQRGVVPSSLSQPAGAAGPMRVMPDVAADADPSTGMLIGLTAQLTSASAPEYVEGVVGGTSLATPLIAGLQADAEQARGAPIGFADPAIYARYGTAAYRDVTDEPLGPGVTIAAADAERDPATGAITDIAVTFARDSSLHATRGYDDVTGVGSPAAAYLRSYRRP
jgi:subtilase family serine protease